MIATEEKARNMFCPVTGGNCIGSECMWWTKEVVGTEEYSPNGLEIQKESDKGYCGMVKNGVTGGD